MGLRFGNEGAERAIIPTGVTPFMNTDPGDSSGLSFRRLRVDDAEAAAELSSQLGYPSSRDDLRKRIEERSRSTDSIALAALIDGQVVGWIDASIEQHLQSSACAVIGGLVVREGTRRLGIGKRLCLEIEEWARSKSIPILRVRSQIVREDAHRFYLREGYSKVKTSVVFEKSL
jgi:GNAT superfamily N-acetyltransferase